MPLVSIVLPTFNEAGNIQRLLQDLAVEFNAIDHEVLVVDDDSPDRTWQVAEAYAAIHPTVRVVRRMAERGLATAVVEGFRQAAGHYVIVMDSDGQHPVEAARRLLEQAMRRDADLVVGSRYAAGGGVEQFHWTRRLTSWVAKTTAFLLLADLHTRDVRDSMSGFFLVRRDRLPPFDVLRPRGYKILLEIIVKAQLGRIFEVGYVFQTRRAGHSKLSLATNFSFLAHLVVLALASRENRRMVAFAVVGLSGIVINLAPIWYAERVLGVVAAAPLLLVGMAAREAAIVWNYAFNDAITFRDLRRATRRRFRHRMIRYHVASLLGFIVYLAVYTTMVVVGFQGVFAAFVGILAGFIANYLGNRHWTYQSAERREATDA